MYLALYEPLSRMQKKRGLTVALEFIIWLRREDTICYKTQLFFDP